MRRRALLAGGGWLALGAPVASRAGGLCRLFPGGVVDEYIGYRDDLPVAHQRFVFERQDGQFVVTSDMDMSFPTRTGERREYAHRCREVWRTGRLHELDSETRANERRLRVHGRRNREGLLVRAEGRTPINFTTYMVPSNLWHRDTRLVQALLDVEEGIMRQVRPTHVAEEELVQAGERLRANRYDIAGQINRVAWYAEDCSLVRWAWPFEDGSRILFVRQPA